MKFCMRKSITLSVNAALTAGVVLSHTYSPTVNAQEDSVEDVKQLDLVQVTGSRIRRTEIEGANPVTILQREDILRTGIQDLGEILQDLPMMSGSPLSTQRNIGGNGEVAVDIRGLGRQRTLLLLNGRRLAPGGNDLSTIPSVLVERVEILKDGASAIYGADAVAGVVNIITRRDFEGVEVEAQYGEAFNEGGPRYSTSLIMGGNTDSGNFVMGLQYSEQDEVFQDVYEQPYLNNSVTIYDPIEFREFGFSGDPWTDEDGSGIAGWGTLGSSRIPYGRFDLREWNPVASSRTICKDSAGGGSQTTDYCPPIITANRPGCGPGLYNYAPVNYIQQPYERSAFFFQADYELLESVSVYLEANFANRLSEQLLAPLPYDSRFDPSYDLIEPGAVISKDNYYNPFGVNVTQWRRRVVEAGGRSFQQSRNQWRVVAGLIGNFGDTWTWDVSYNYSAINQGETEFGQFNGARLALAMGPSFLDPRSGEIVCGTPDEPVLNCVSLNAFSNPDTNPITQEMVSYLQSPLVRKSTSSREVMTAIVTGDLFNLPAGPLSSAFGVQQRSDQIESLRDSREVVGLATGFNGGGLIGDYKVKSIFAEVNVPVLSGLKGAELLEFGLGARWDDFSAFDSATTLNASMRWKPIRMLLLRATVGQVYREPNISELFAGNYDQFFDGLRDPCSGAGGTPGCEDVPPSYVQIDDDDVRVTVGGNPNVTPEEGDTMTLGLVWSPEFAPGFSMTLDWWRVDIDDGIAGEPGPNFIIEGCFNGLLEFCDRIHRYGPQSPSWGGIDYLDGTTQKIGPEGAEGLDFSFNYNLNSEIGLWDFSWWGSYNLAREHVVIKDRNADGVADVFVGDSVGLYEHRAGFFLAAYPEFRWRLDTDWNLGNWGVSLSVEFIKGVTECGSIFADPNYLTMYCPDDPEIVGLDPADTYWGIPIADRAWINTIDDMFYFDLVSTYTLPLVGTEISAGIHNLTDQQLPFLNQGLNATSDADTYRAFGRSWFVRIRHSF
jgi:iron complex outermembrane receptor protein